ncbi:hypothetical protein RI129_013110 [Pyrocoelia pectoralis]|uniref:Cytochrome P450 n=1 Tax=Pyrocoelia pectoralis TaxID=417401 RepID=A0AAN7UVK0_9COLE
MSLASVALCLFSILICSLLLLITLIVFYFKRSWSFWKSKNVTDFPVVFPYGNAKDILLRKISFGEKMAKIYNECKSKGLRYCGFYVLSKPMLVVTDLELVKAITTKDFQYFTDHPIYVNEDVDPLTGHLFSLRGERWRNIRAKLSPVYTSGKLKMMFQTIVDCSPELVNVVGKCAKDNVPLDTKDVTERFTIDIIGTCAFGIECNSLLNPHSEFHKIGLRMFKQGPIDSLRSFTSMIFPQFLDFFKIPLLKKDVTKFFLKVVNETVKYREDNEIIRNDFMHLLLQLKNNINIEDESHGSGKFFKKGSDTTLTINEVAAHAFVFFIAGFEASSITLAFCLYELSVNMDLQSKLRKEIHTVLQKHDSKLTYEALMEMNYMEQCIYETLRIYPTATYLSRLCTKTYHIPDSDVIIDKGTHLHIPILGIQRDPEYFPDPLKFNPDRFSAENKAGRHPCAWMPFGEGPRICIGMKFGVIQTKVGLTTLLMNYKFTVNSKTSIPLRLVPAGHSTRVEGGIWLNVSKVEE